MIRLLPFHYATRNLLREPGRLAQTVGGSALVVGLFLSAGAFNQGMIKVLAGTGAPQNVILLGAGSEESIERSEIKVQTIELAAAGIRHVAERGGVRAVSGEVHYMGSLFAPQSSDPSAPRRALIRGVTPRAFEVHQSVQIVEGDFPRAGEVMIGVLASHALKVPPEALRIGNFLEFEGQIFRISARFIAPETVLESEVWMNRTDLMTLTQRETLSCVVVRLSDPRGFASAELFAKQRLDLELSAIPETSYYAQLASFYGPIRAMTWLTAGLIGAGAIFGGFNMLYAAYAARSKEMATLLAIGFSRTAIVVSLLQESLLATLSGTLLATWLGLVLIDGRAVYFSMGTFSLDLTLSLLTAGIAVGLALGLLGTLPPAFRCLGAPLTQSLRT